MSNFGSNLVYFHGTIDTPCTCLYMDKDIDMQAHATERNQKQTKKHSKPKQFTEWAVVIPQSGRQRDRQTDRQTARRNVTIIPWISSSDDFPVDRPCRPSSRRGTDSNQERDRL
jgi:hypothetical protein